LIKTGANIGYSTEIDRKMLKLQGLKDLKVASPGAIYPVKGSKIQACRILLLS
jgi:hypothetical protein